MNFIAILKAFKTLVDLLKSAWEWLSDTRTQGQIGKIEELAAKRNDLLKRMEAARVAKDFVLYEKLFDEYARLKNE